MKIPSIITRSAEKKQVAAPKPHTQPKQNAAPIDRETKTLSPELTDEAAVFEPELAEELPHTPETLSSAADLSDEEGDPYPFSRREEPNPLSPLAGDKAGQAAGGVPTGAASLENPVSRLTRRLVAAESQLEVHNVMSEAGSSMVKLRLAAAMGDQKTAQAAQAIIKKLEKLMGRGRKKISNLGEEDKLRRNEIKAERDKQDVRARQIRAELRKRLIERKNRERDYLREADEDQPDTASPAAAVSAAAQAKLDAASESRIEMQAKMLAAAEIGAPPTSGYGDTSAADVSAAAAPSGGAEPSVSPEGGEETGGTEEV